VCGESIIQDVATRDDSRRSVLRLAGWAVGFGYLSLLVLSVPLFAEIDRTRLERIAALVESAIDAGKLPGGVVLVGHGGEVVYERAFGARSVDGMVEPMTVDTVFDLASLTKAVATTTSVMVLVEEGRLRLRDPVASHIPEFASHGKDRITVEHLLTHVSGLRPDLPLEEVFDGAGIAIARTVDEVPEAAPGERFIYSDLNFMMLAEVVRRVTGQTLDEFARERIFEPLGMRDTLFTPPASLVPRIAPTEACAPLAWPCGGPAARMLRGQVHDPTARRMGGVAGHAGLFSTAHDLARFSLMLLGDGALDGVRVLAPSTVARMTQVSTPAHMADRRGLGWDIDSRFSSNRGDLFPVGSFGHTGFTGTSLWLDPDSDTFVVFLSSRLHPSGGGDVTALRGHVSTVVAASLRDQDTSGATTPLVRTGIDVLREEGFARLSGSRVGLVTNQTGRARDGVSTVDLLHQEPSVELVALFSPEHGFRGIVDGPVSSDRDPGTGLPIYSLYGETRRPRAAALEGLDTIVIDLQDVGARFYTYATTMAYMLEAASEVGARVVVLDRPNPIGGAVEGPALDDAQLGFTGYFPAPVRHGLTLGELARLFNAERGIEANLEVVSVRGWRRSSWFDETGLSWVNPSPNMRNMHQALLYPGIGAIEGANLSVGRGTDTPFEQIGAPWIDGPRLARELSRLALPGVRVYPVRFSPSSSRFAGERCEGVFFVVTDRERFRPVRLGLEVAAALHRLFGDRFDLDAVVRLFGSAAMVSKLRAGDATWEIAAAWAADQEAWRRLAAPYLLYE
jgi:uncharacterized protein YbbC (DUF1343 family)